MFDCSIDTYSFFAYLLLFLALFPFLVVFVSYFVIGFISIYTLYFDAVFKFFVGVFDSVFGGDR